MNFQIASKVREVVYNKDTTYHTKLANREYGHISKKRRIETRKGVVTDGEKNQARSGLQQPRKKQRTCMVTGPEVVDALFAFIHIKFNSGIR